ncbi:hypothetical protein ABT154_21660 [Streptomyces sp. NPDC001728]|uniref:hypothetical protein n=1 Tax=Streptomyces sp. NPDC001728 TaxID=3154396 RepID=UPI003326CC4A
MSSNVTPRPTNTHPATTYRAAAQAAHEERCNHCRTLTEAADARRTSMARLTRLEHKQLGLILDMSDGTFATRLVKAVAS